MEVLRWIDEFIRREKMPPSIHEVSIGTGCSARGGATSSIKALQREGLLLVRPRIARGLIVTAAGKAALAQSFCQDSAASLNAASFSGLSTVFSTSGSKSSAN